MPKPIRLTEDEVTTAAQLAGVPPALALAVWAQNKSVSVDALDQMLSSLSEGLRKSGGDWQGATQQHYENEQPDMPNDLGSNADIPGYTGPMNGSSMAPYNTNDPELNQQGSNNYALDKYIRRL